jgi:hypothetical protein
MHIQSHTHTHTHTYIRIYIFTYLDCPEFSKLHCQTLPTTKQIWTKRWKIMGMTLIFTNTEGNFVDLIVDIIVHSRAYCLHKRKTYENSHTLTHTHT